MPTRARKTLTEKERRFVEAYMGKAAGNGTKAAIQAGYAKRSAAVTASQLLRKPNIKAAVEQRIESDPEVLTREGRQRLWTRFANDPEVSHRDRLRATELLGRTQGDFVEKHQVEHHFDPAEFLASLTPDKAPPQAKR